MKKFLKYVGVILISILIVVIGTIIGGIVVMKYVEPHLASENNGLKQNFGQDNLKIPKHLVQHPLKHTEEIVQNVNVFSYLIKIKNTSEKIFKPISVPVDSYIISTEKDQYKSISGKDSTMFFGVDRWEKEGKIVIDQLIRYECLKKGINIVDFGGGTGYYSLLFSQIVGVDGKVYLVDMNLTTLQNALQVIRYNNSVLVKSGIRKNYTNIIPVLSSINDFFVTDNSIDTVFICAVHCFHNYDRTEFQTQCDWQKSKQNRNIIYCHIREKNKQIITNIYNCLKTNGHLVIIEDLSKKGSSLRLDREGIIKLFKSFGFSLVADLHDLEKKQHNNPIHFMIFRKK